MSIGSGGVMEPTKVAPGTVLTAVRERAMERERALPSIPGMGELPPQSPVHWRQPWSVGTQAQDHQLVAQSQVSQKASCGRSSARLQPDEVGHSTNESCGRGFRETSWKPSVFGWMRFLPTTPPAFSDHPNQVCPNRV